MFCLFKTNAAIILPAPIGLTAVSTQIEGQVKLNWISCKGANIYVVQSTNSIQPMPGQTWDMVAESSKATVLINDLLPGNIYYFRVAVINSAGISGWSEIAICRPN